MMSAPVARTSSGCIALTVAAVPTGMKAGVRISPRRMAIAPVRAVPSVAAMVKAKRRHPRAMPRWRKPREQLRNMPIRTTAARVPRPGLLLASADVVPPCCEFIPNRPDLMPSIQQFDRFAFVVRCAPVWHDGDFPLH